MSMDTDGGDDKAFEPGSGAGFDYPADMPDESGGGEPPEDYAPYRRHGKVKRAVALALAVVIAVSPISLYLVGRFTYIRTPPQAGRYEAVTARPPTASPSPTASPR